MLRKGQKTVKLKCRNHGRRIFTHQTKFIHREDGSRCDDKVAVYANETFGAGAIEDGVTKGYNRPGREVSRKREEPRFSGRQGRGAGRRR